MNKEYVGTELLPINNKHMTNEKINQIIKKSHEVAKGKGFWDKPNSSHVIVMLIISEIGEAVEAWRTNNKAEISPYVVEILDRDKYTEVEKKIFEREIKGTVDEELADIFIRICDYLGFVNRNMDESRSIPVYLFNNSFVEDMYQLTSTIVHCFDEDDILYPYLLVVIDNIASNYGIDLEKMIEYKTKYNITRPRLHGKNF